MGAEIMADIAFITLGCKVNTYESNAIRDKFISLGHRIVDENSVADAYIINTCAVTNMADRKSRKMIRHARRLNPNACICAMGCFIQTNKDAINISEADILLGNNNKGLAVEKVLDFLKNRKRFVEINDITKEKVYDNLRASEFDQTRAFIKIEDGCQNFCSYCIIPYARGPVRSKPIDDCIAEIKEIAANGYEEIVFTGIDTGKYYSNGCRLSDLIKRIKNEIKEIKRIRLSSVEINSIDDSIVNLMKDDSLIADQIHLPIQSGCDKILKLMNRKYDVKSFEEHVKRIREVRPDISISTDVIVGFPGETNEDFLETVETIKRIGFSELNVFPYSKRNGTPAALMPQVSDDIKKERVQVLLDLSKKLSYEYAKRFEGKILSVIFENHPDKEFIKGHSSNYLFVEARYDKNYIHKMCNVKILKVGTNAIFGEIIE